MSDQQHQSPGLRALEALAEWDRTLEALSGSFKDLDQASSQEAVDLAIRAVAEAAGNAAEAGERYQGFRREWDESLLLP